MLQVWNHQQSLPQYSLTVCRLTTHLYRVVLMVLHSFSTLQHPGVGELWAGCVLISFLWSISAPTWALVSSNTVLRLDPPPLLRVPLGVLDGLLFLFLLLLLLRVRVSFPLPVLSQLEGRRIKFSASLNSETPAASKLHLTRTSRSQSKICLCNSV